MALATTETNPNVHHGCSELPEGTEAVVFARADDTGESVLHAHVVPEPVNSLDEAEASSKITDHLRAKLTWYKVPHRIQLVTEIPRTSFGKIARRRLREGQV